MSTTTHLWEVTPESCVLTIDWLNNITGGQFTKQYDLRGMSESQILIYFTIWVVTAYSYTQSSLGRCLLDFIDGLKRSDENTTLMVVVDRLTKSAHLIPLSHPYTARTVANKFVDNILKLHGIPRSIVSDRDHN